MFVLALQAAAAFNVVCTGTLTLNGMERPDETVLRVDLESRRFCFADCGRVEPIERVTDAEIVFQDVSLPATGGRVLRRFDRATGDYLLSSVAGAVDIQVRGRCVEAPFTGFRRR